MLSHMAYGDSGQPYNSRYILMIEILKFPTNDILYQMMPLPRNTQLVLWPIYNTVQPVSGKGRPP